MAVEAWGHISPPPPNFQFGDFTFETIISCAKEWPKDYLKRCQSRGARWLTQPPTISEPFQWPWQVQYVAAILQNCKTVIGYYLHKNCYIH